MSCRRICRELLWLARFGELGPSSQPHLDHLAGCRGCRDEVGFDREMVRQLRVALAERVDGLQPSSAAWEGILRRAQAPEPSRFAAWWQRSMGVIGRLRTATAMAGTGLALVLALNMEVMPITAPASSGDSAAGAQAQPAERIPASERGNRAILQVTPAQPHPEAVIALPLARTDLQPAGPRVPDAPPGELVALELTFRSASSPPTIEPAEEVSPPDAEVEPPPVEPGLAS
ncbi:MAG TPA: hypothetical protein VF365_05580 [Candidatus Limnocylindria bacterium]